MSATVRSRRSIPLSLDMNPLDLIEREFLFGSVVKLRGAGRFVARNLRRNLQRASIAQVLGDAGTAEAVTGDLIG